MESGGQSTSNDGNGNDLKDVRGGQTTFNNGNLNELRSQIPQNGDTVTKEQRAERIDFERGLTAFLTLWRDRHGLKPYKQPETPAAHGQPKKQTAQEKPDAKRQKFEQMLMEKGEAQELLERLIGEGGEATVEWAESVAFPQTQSTPPPTFTCNPNNQTFCVDYQAVDPQHGNTQGQPSSSAHTVRVAVQQLETKTLQQLRWEVGQQGQHLQAMQRQIDHYVHREHQSHHSMQGTCNGLVNEQLHQHQDQLRGGGQSNNWNGFDDGQYGVGGSNLGDERNIGWQYPDRYPESEAVVWLKSFATNRENYPEHENLFDVYGTVFEGKKLYEVCNMKTKDLVDLHKSCARGDREWVGDDKTLHILIEAIEKTNLADNGYSGKKYQKRLDLFDYFEFFSLAVLENNGSELAFAMILVRIMSFVIGVIYFVFGVLAVLEIRNADRDEPSEDVTRTTLKGEVRWGKYTDGVFPFLLFVGFLYASVWPVQTTFSLTRPHDHSGKVRTRFVIFRNNLRICVFWFFLSYALDVAHFSQIAPEYESESWPNRTLAYGFAFAFVLFIMEYWRRIFWTVFLIFAGAGWADWASTASGHQKTAYIIFALAFLVCLLALGFGYVKVWIEIKELVRETGQHNHPEWLKIKDAKETKELCAFTREYQSQQLQHRGLPKCIANTLVHVLWPARIRQKVRDLDVLYDDAEAISPFLKSTVCHTAEKALGEAGVLHNAFEYNFPELKLVQRAISKCVRTYCRDTRYLTDIQRMGITFRNIEHITIFLKALVNSSHHELPLSFTSRFWNLLDELEGWFKKRRHSLQNTRRDVAILKIVRIKNLFEIRTESRSGLWGLLCDLMPHRAREWGGYRHVSVNVEIGFTIDWAADEPVKIIPVSEWHVHAIAGKLHKHICEIQLRLQNFYPVPPEKYAKLQRKRGA